MASTTKEVVVEFPNYIKVYSDGSVERIFGSPYVPPSLDHDTETGLSVSSKDITISEDPKISARLYLPKLTQPDQKFPILVYFHAGAFCFESAFSFLHHRYINALVSEAQVVAVSVEYRLAPEAPVPAGFEDSWYAFKWVVSTKSEPWILNHGDLDRLYVGGDSAGASIVNNLALRAGAEGLPCNAKISGAVLSHPYFWGSKAIKNEASENRETNMTKLIWEFAYPGAPGGIDNPLINPVGPGTPSLAGLGCCKMLVCVAGKDELRDRGELYYETVKESGWKGEVEFFEIEGEDHAFHIYDTETENAMKMIKRLASFLFMRKKETITCNGRKVGNWQNFHLIFFPI